MTALPNYPERIKSGQGVNIQYTPYRCDVVGRIAHHSGNFSIIPDTSFDRGFYLGFSVGLVS